MAPAPQVNLLKQTACVSVDSAPPSIIGTYSAEGDGRALVSGTKELRSAPSGDLGFFTTGFSKRIGFSQTVPADPRIVVVHDIGGDPSLSRIDPAELHEVNLAGVWVWGGCHWALHCVERGDIGITIYTPTKLGADGHTVLMFDRSYMETGPKYMVPDTDSGAAIVNPYHAAMVSVISYSRCEECVPTGTGILS
jgi:hypothetical protein